MKWLSISLLTTSLLLSDTLHFGAIATMHVDIMKKKMSPLLKYLEKKTGHTIIFHSGRNYDNTIEKFVDGSYDFGYIGPAPYVLATRKSDNLHILAGLETNNSPYFHSTIVIKKGSSITSLEQLKDKTFAFGSPQSTLSYYVPMSMLLQNGITHELKSSYFLGRHDRVAEYVIMGRYDAGGVKEEVAKLYKKYLDIIAISEPIYDFCIVANSKMDSALQEKIKQALLSLKDKKILSSIKKSASGFSLRKDSDYDNLRLIMKEVESQKN